jgi:hypothetical protein
MHKIMHAYELHPDDMEKIQMVIFRPKWSLAFKIHIPLSKEQAIEEIDMDIADVMVFSDG